MKDTDFLAHVLADRKWHGWSEIQRRSAVERGYGLTINSRAAELRRRVQPDGLTVECRSSRRNGRTTSQYRLAPLDPATTASGAGLTLPAPSLPVVAGSSGSEPDEAIPGQLVLEGAAA